MYEAMWHFMQSREEHNFEQLLKCCVHRPSTARSCPEAHAASETTHDGRIVCWTDGACSNNYYRHLRRGGCGIFYADEHPFNGCYPLPGVQQTNQRAELHALITAIETEQRSMTVSMCVTDLNPF